MRKRLGLGGRRARAAVRAHVQPGDAIEAVARDDIARDYLVLTSRQLFRVRQGVVVQRMEVTSAGGAVTEQATGVTIRVHTRQPSDGHMVSTFRTHNDLTRRLAAMLQPPPAGDE
jgi:hypothetical protein